jgi:hypothetical protein
VSRRPKNLAVAKTRAWKAISKYIRQKNAVDGYVKCCTCETVKYYSEMDCGHFQHGLTYAEVGGEFRVLEENLAAQCVSCNKHHHGRADEYFLYVEKHYGRKVAEDLMSMKKSKQTLKIRLDDYWGIEQKYKELVEDLI